MGRRIVAVHLDMVDSTNDAARRLLARGGVDRRGWVLARGQSCGRGTRGRRWISPYDAGLYLSVIDVPEAPHHLALSLFTPAAGVAAAHALRAVTGVPVVLKPINDLCVAGRKIGGILTEVLYCGSRLRAVIIGIGINLQRAHRPVSHTGLMPTCLQELISGQDFARLDRISLARKIVARVYRWNRVAAAGRGSIINQQWQDLVAPEIA